MKTKSGIYKLNCNDCNKFYIGQTGRKFIERYKEHLPAGKSDITLKFALHIVNSKHNCTNLETNLTPIHLCNKDRYLNALKEFEIYKATIENKDNFLNDQIYFKSNTLFNTAINLNKQHKHTHNQ